MFSKLCSQCVFFGIFTLIYILHINWTASLNVNHKKVLLIFNVLIICVCLYLCVCMFVSVMVFFFQLYICICVLSYYLYMYLVNYPLDCINKFEIWWIYLSPMVCTRWSGIWLSWHFHQIYRYRIYVGCM